MDQFLKEYRERIKKMGREFDDKRQDLAKLRIKMFAATLTRVLTVNNERFDVIFGSGNSGLFMTRMTKIVYEYLELSIPPIITLPIYRWDGNTEEKEHDNSSLIFYLKDQMKDVKKIENILFVDDEIMRGLTAKIAFELFLKSLPAIKHINATIIAEHHFFEWHYKIPQVSVNFFAYEKLIPGINGNIGYFVPEELFKSLQSIFPEVLSYNHAMAIIIGGALKHMKENGEQYFDTNVEQEAISKIPHYEDTKKVLKDEMEMLLKQGVDEYKQGKIVFKF